MAEEKKKMVVVIVGGGPAGATTAKAMCDRGYDVKVMEAYKHPLEISKKSPMAYAISIRERGCKSLESALFGPAIHSIDDTCQKLQDSIPKSVISHCMVRHSRGKTSGRNSSASLVVPRKYLSSGLLNLASEAGVEIQYETKLTDIDVNNHIAIFKKVNLDSEEGTTISISYDLLIGTDGSNSTVRTLLDKKANDFSIIRVEEDSMEYQVVTIPKSKGGSPDSLFPGSPETAVHVWNDSKYNSICLAFPLAPGIGSSDENDDNGGTILPVVFPEGKLAEFRNNSAYEEPIKALFPDLSDTIRNDVISEQLKTGQSGNGGKCVWCTSMGSIEHSVLLIGDSAHGMWPSLGQGCNCALESVAVFVNTIDDINSDKSNNQLSSLSWCQLLIKEYNNRRYDDVIAAVDLTYGGIGARKSRGRQNSPMMFKVQIALMMLLHVLSCKLIPKPAMLRLMVGEAVPYSKIKKSNFIYEKFVTYGILFSLGSGIVYKYAL